MYGSNTICNSSGPSLVDIVQFDLSCIVVSFTVFKTRLPGRGFHTLIRNVLFPSSIYVGSHNPPPWGPTLSLRHHLMSISNIICNSSRPLLVDLVRFGPSCIVINFTVFKTCLPGRGFHTLIRNVSFSSPTDVGSHTLSPSTLMVCPTLTIINRYSLGS